MGSFRSPGEDPPQASLQPWGARLLGALGLEMCITQSLPLVTGHMPRGALLVSVSLWHLLIRTQ